MPTIKEMLAPFPDTRAPSGECSQAAICDAFYAATMRHWPGAVYDALAAATVYSRDRIIEITDAEFGPDDMGSDYRENFYGRG